MKNIFSKVFFIFCMNFCAQAQNLPISNSDEIIGCWERIEFSDATKKIMNEIEPWPLPYQWFCFEQDSTYFTYMSNTPQSPTTSDFRKSIKILPKSFTYSILPQSFIKTEAASGKETLYWASAFLGATREFDGKIIEKGTLIMSLYDQKKNKAIYWRYLKKIN